LAFVLVSLATFAVLAIHVTADETPWLDIRILRLVPPSNDPNRLANLCNAFVAAGIAFGVVLVAVVFFWLLVRRNWRPALFWFSTFAGVAALDLSGKAIFERPPIGDLAGGYSFPSGNAMASMALLVAATTLVSRGRTRRLLLTGGAGLVTAYGAALVYISWHYPTDVVGGWLLSLAWVSFLHLTIQPRDALTTARSPGVPVLSPPPVSRD
jgi:undecaprenyl-diphosphatase